MAAPEPLGAGAGAGAGAGTPCIEEEHGLVVVSPHLDDAALSLGAAIALASQSGIPVKVLTVFAGDPNSDEPARMWDTLCGFSTAGEAARSRRAEDARACEILGAEPAWLPFAYADQADGQARNEDEIWAAVWPHLREAKLVLLPGHPLTHPDHAWLTRLLAERAPASPEVGVYVEQPYANLYTIGSGFRSGPALRASALALRTPFGRALQRPARVAVRELFNTPLEWYAARAERSHRRAKIDAINAYSSQVASLSRFLLPRIRLYEWAWRGEGIGLVLQPSRRSLRGWRRTLTWGPLTLT